MKMKLTPSRVQASPISTTRTMGGSFRSACFHLTIAFATLALFACLVPSSSAQYIKLDTPYNNATESYYENIGVDFGFRFNGSNNNGRGIVGLNPDGSFTRDGSIRFTQNGAGSAVPPFGGYDPSSDATFGYGHYGGGGGYNLGLRLGQGNTRTMTNTTPSIVVPNGVGGSISDQIQRPFVTGITPVVGTFPRNFSMVPRTVSVSPLAIKMQQLQQELDAGRASRTANGGFVLHGDGSSEETTQRATSSAPAAESSATSGALSVAELKRRREASQATAEKTRSSKIDELMAKANQSIADGKSGVARIYVRQAIREAEGQERQELLELYRSLEQQ